MSEPAQARDSKDLLARRMLAFQAARRDWAEKQARANGYTGEWPPRISKIIDTGMFQGYMDKLRNGEHRAGFIAALMRASIVFYAGLQPEDFARFGQRIKEAFFRRGNTTRTRMQAIKALFKPLCGGVRLLRRAQSSRLHRDPLLIEHLCACLQALAEQFSNADIEAMAEYLKQAAASARNDTALFSALRTAMEMVETVAEIVSEMQALFSADPAPPRDTPLELSEQTLKELRDIEARIVSESQLRIVNIEDQHGRTIQPA